MANSGPTTLDPVQLAAQARTAYELKRTRDCLALLRTLAKVDPSNREAESLQRAIRADIQRDLEDVRSLIEDSDADGDKKKYRMAAEIILRKTLNIDPENDEARSLLQSIRSIPELQTASPAQSYATTQPASERRDEIEFVAAPTLERAGKPEKRIRMKLPLALIAVAIIGGGWFLRQPSSPSRTNPMASDTRTGSASDSNFSPRPTGTPNTSTATPTAPAPAAPTTMPSGPQTQLAALPAANSASALNPATPVTPPTVPVPNAKGKLAVSSPIAAEIYLSGRYLGSTPITLELPAGRQALEYRNGDLRTTANYDIKADRTTTATVMFRATVQINARPWAQVYLDGTKRQSLGQTPLSGVTVPIGGVLVFENPNFTSKSYRVTEKDTAIQVDFP